MFDVLVYLYENYWRPDACPDHRQLTRVAAPAPGYTPAFAFYPLAFEAPMSTLGA
jgi:hypothetical protein